MYGWHTDVKGARNAREAMSRAGFLNWGVRKEKIFLAGESEIANHKAVVRDNPKTALGLEVLTVASNKYRVIQNEEYANVIDRVIYELDATYQDAAHFKGGVTVLELARESKGWIKNREIPIYSKICIWNSHDRSRSFQFEIVLMDEDKSTYIFSKSYRRKHLSKPKDDLLSTLEFEAKKLVMEVDIDLNNFMLASQELGQFDLSVADFTELLKELFVITDAMKQPEKDKILNKRQEISDIFRKDPRLERFRGTAWAGYLAITHYLDDKLEHFSRAYSISPESKSTKGASWDAICKRAKVRQIEEPRG